MTAHDPLILNVDDTEAGRYAKTRSLQHAGFRVIEATRGRDALELVAREQPDLVVLDIMLPDMGGLEVCAQIKRDHPEILVLQVSAMMISAADRVRGLDSGADAYLSEPVAAGELVAVVRALLRMRKAELALNEALQNHNAELQRRLEEQRRQLEHETAERMQAEEALRHAQKMEAVGQLTGGIAHDFNNLLTAISGNLELAQRRAPEGDPMLVRLLAHASEAADRAAALTQRLLAFSRRQAVAPRAVDVNALVQGLEEMLRRSLGEQIELAIELHEAAGVVWCDQSQMESALLNLAINARDAMPAGGRLTVRTRSGSLEVPAGEQRHARPGVFTTLEVSDTGTGMSEEVKAQAFEPFFTTKPVGQGTGLGLSQIYGFCRQARGWASIESEPGRGTTVSLHLPQADAGLKPAPRRAAARRAASGAGELVLLVEDEELVRALVVQALQERGYAVHETSAAQEALDRLASGRVHYDLMVTDVGLPQLNGRELAELARSRPPGLKVLFMTGYAREAGTDSEPLPQGADLISKPFTMEQLLTKVRSLLDAR